MHRSCKPERQAASTLAPVAGARGYSDAKGSRPRSTECSHRPEAKEPQALHRCGKTEKPSSSFQLEDLDLGDPERALREAKSRVRLHARRVRPSHERKVRTLLHA